MTIPLDIISGALLDLGVRAAGETVEADDANEAFTLLNMMLDQWSNESLMVVSTAEIVHSIAGSQFWTIGPGGQIDTVRPLGINGAFVRVASIDYPVSVIDVNQWESIGLKGLNGPWPRAVYYNSGSPLGTLNFWPLPSSGEIHLFVDQLFTQFATLFDALALPPGYLLALRRCLACELAPSYGKKADMRLAMQAKGAIKGTNATPAQVAQFDGALTRQSGRADAGFILSGGF